MKLESNSPHNNHAVFWGTLEFKSFVEDEGILGDSDSHEEEQPDKKNLRYVIRKTFIDVDNSPNLNLTHREVRSCPNTHLLAHATPRRGPPNLPLGLSVPSFDATFAPATEGVNAAAYQDSPRSRPLSPQLTPSFRALGSPELSETVPWGPDVLAELVANAAAAVERHTPALSYAEASPEPSSMWQNTPSTCAAPIAEPFSRSGLPDLVAAAVSFAAGGHGEAHPAKISPLEPYTSPCIWDAYPMETLPGMVAPFGLTANPAKCMVPSSALRLLLDELIESDQDGYEVAQPFDALLEDVAKDEARPVDNLLMDAADGAASNSTSVVSSFPPETRQSSVFPYANATPSQEILESVHEPKEVQGHSAKSKRELTTECTRDGAHSLTKVAAPSKDNREERTDEFVQKWGLDARSLAVIRQLSAEDFEEVLSDFDANANTKNVNAKFMVWIDSRLRRAEARRQRLMLPPTPASDEALAEFFKKWSLDRRSQRYVQSLPPTVQCTLLESFNPPPDTRSLDAKLVAFVKLQLNKESTKCLRLANGGVSSSVGMTLRGPEEIRGASSGEDQQQHQRQHRHDRGGYSLGQNYLRPIEPLEDCARHFAVLWGLDSSNEASLRSLPEHDQQAIIMKFRAAGKQSEINRRFSAFLRNWIGNTAANGMPAIGNTAANGSCQGGGGGDCRYSRRDRRPKRQGPAAGKSCKESVHAAVAAGLVQPAAV